MKKAVKRLTRPEPQARIQGVHDLRDLATEHPALHWRMLEQLSASIRGWSRAHKLDPPRVFLDDGRMWGFRLDYVESHALDRKPEIEAALQVIGARVDDASRLDVAPREVVAEFGAYNRGGGPLNQGQCRNSIDRIDPKGTPPHPKHVPTFEGTDVPGVVKAYYVDLSNLHLEHTHLSTSSLAGLRFVDSSFRASVLERSAFDKADLERADLCYCLMYGASLREAYARDVRMVRTDLGGADLRDAFLVGADLRGSNFYKADLRGACLYGANLGHFTTLRFADCRGATFANCDFGSAVLTSRDGAQAWREDPSRVRSEVEARAREGVFHADADLRGADLRFANFAGAYFVRADLRGADLRYARGLDLSQLECCCADGRTRFPDDVPPPVAASLVKRCEGLTVSSHPDAATG